MKYKDDIIVSLEKGPKEMGVVQYEAYLKHLAEFSQVEFTLEIGRMVNSGIIQTGPEGTVSLVKETEPESKQLEWKTHLPNLFNEILNNPGTGILTRPLQITSNILHDVATRASELNDPVLNHLMCRLAMYAIADPEQPEEHDPEAVRVIQKQARTMKDKTNVRIP